MTLKSGIARPLQTTSSNTREDGSNLGPTLAYLFQILNTPEDARPKNLDDDLAVFTYINGDMFAETLPIPSCDRATRNALLEACKFDWSVISPAVFGSMFQNVMTPAERRELGAHYTTEENILKTIRPLFLDDLEAELSRATSKASLDRFHDKIAGLTFLDPACGCGNFLVIAYRELRRIENDLWEKRSVVTEREGMSVFDVSQVCRITVDQFYGVEIEEFPARIARTAMYLIDHKANLEFSQRFGQYFVRFPIPASPHIRVGNALRFDWNDLLPAEMANYVFGNPPFVGMAMMNKEQQEDNREVFDDRDAKKFRSGRLDYVACWYEKAISYVGHLPVGVAFVSTNSITQGEQARGIAPMLLDRGMSIDFAHTTFAWKSEAQGRANVHCVIIGFSYGEKKGSRRLFEYETLKGSPIERRVANINIWLANGPNVTFDKRTAPLVTGFPNATKGSQPTDGGYLIVEIDEIEKFRADPVAAKYLRQYVQGHGMLHDEGRWCLWLADASASELRSSPLTHDRLEMVAHWRRTESKTGTVQQAATTPALFTQNRQPSIAYLALPETSSETRRYIPGRFYEPDVIAGNTLIIFPGAELWHFGLIHSLMWNAWIKAVGGRMKSDIRFSPSLGYFTFPFPDVTVATKKRLAVGAEAVLEARAAQPEATLADLYDPVAMPDALVDAHDELDAIVDSLFAPRKRFTSDSDRLSILFDRYETLSFPSLLLQEVEEALMSRPANNSRSEKPSGFTEAGFSRMEPTYRLNAICPYYTMFPLEFPWRVLRSAKVEDWVLDPFCGRGTSLFAARLRGLGAVGLDLNPVAATLAAANSATSYQAVSSLCAKLLSDGGRPVEQPVGEFWKLAFHSSTLRQICLLREGLEPWHLMPRRQCCVLCSLASCMDQF